MQNEDMDFSSSEKCERGTRQAKGCCFLIVSIIVAFFILLFAAVAGFIILDTINLRGEDHSLAWRVKRYKVVCQFLWFDFKDYVSRRLSESSPVEPEIVQTPVDPPESEPETEPESGP